jgi:hypothetical protein
MTRGGVRTADYYYCETIHIDPSQYSCNRLDGLDKLYKATQGSLITQIVQYDDLYTFVSQISAVRNMPISESAFALPTGIKIVEQKR